MPVIVALAIAFLLDLPVNRLIGTGMSRPLATTVIVTLFITVSIITLFGILPIVWQQSTNLLQETPAMFAQGESYLLTLPEKYPELVQADQVESVIQNIKQALLDWGQVALKASISSISNVVALMVYCILVPLMVFFFLKDKAPLIAAITQYLPKDREKISQVGKEMHQQIMNYIRGKVIEIIIIGGVSTITFAFLGLNYSVLLGVLVGFSVLVPYVGATLVTIPVMLVALFQFGFTAEFGYVMLAYGIIQALDGNLLVPLLFSEAVNLHPVTIIIAVIFFGGLWGFWGVFFAIPLATLVKAVINALPSEQIDQEQPST